MEYRLMKTTDMRSKPDEEKSDPVLENFLKSWAAKMWVEDSISTLVFSYNMVSLGTLARIFSIPGSRYTAPNSASSFAAGVSRIVSWSHR